MGRNPPPDDPGMREWLARVRRAMEAARFEQAAEMDRLLRGYREQIDEIRRQSEAFLEAVRRRGRIPRRPPRRPGRPGGGGSETVPVEPNRPKRGEGGAAAALEFDEP